MSYLDTRDLYDELVDLRERNEAAADFDHEADAFEPLDEDEQARLTALEELADEIGEDTLRNGETMIPVNDFEDYAQELAEEMGMLDHNVQWPFNHIDWAAAADELSVDYTEVSWDGTDYYVRTY